MPIIISAEFMMSVIHSSDPKDVTIREPRNETNTQGGYLEGQPEGLVGGPAGGNDGIKSLKKGHAVGLAFLPLNVPALNSAS